MERVLHGAAPAGEATAATHDAARAGVVLCEPPAVLARGGRTPSAAVRRARALLLGEASVYGFALALLDGKTILPAFAAHYTQLFWLLGLIPAWRMAGLLLPQLPAAVLMARAPRKRPWLLGCGAVGRLTLLVTPLAVLLRPAIAPLALLLLFFGSLVLFTIAEACTLIAWYGIIAVVLPGADRAWLFGRMQVGAAAAGVLAGLGLGRLLSGGLWPFPQNYGYLFLIAAWLLLLSFSLLFLLEEPAQSIPARVPGLRESLALGAASLLGRGPFSRLLQLQALLGLATLADGLYTPYALRVLGLGPAVVGYGVAAFAVGSGVGGLVLPAVAVRRGSLAVLRLVAPVLALAPALTAAASVAGPLASACFLFSFGAQGLVFTATYMAFNDLALAYAPAGQGQLYAAIVNTAGGLLLPVPLLGGVLASWLGPLPVLVLTVLLQLPAWIVLGFGRLPALPWRSWWSLLLATLCMGVSLVLANRLTLVSATTAGRGGVAPPARAALQAPAPVVLRPAGADNRPRGASSGTIRMQPANALVPPHA